MKFIITISAMAMLAAGSAHAQTSRTATVDGPNYSGTRTTTIDPTTGTASRDGSLTRKSDGAVATRELDRTRTENGVSIQGNSSNFAGETRNLDYNRTRTDTGSTATGSLTRRNGETLTYDASRTRGNGSLTAQQNLTGANGQSLYARTATSTRTATGVSRSVNATRAPGCRARGARRR
jgi:hypothetical protein